MLKASVVILSYNGGAVLRETLDAVLKQRSDAMHEILVIDSGSRDGSVEYLRGQPVRLVEIPNDEFGHGATRNLAARLANGDIVVYLSQDATPANETWLDALLAPLEDQHLGGVYGRQLPRASTHVCERFFLEETYTAEPAQRALPNDRQATLRDIFFSNVNAACRKELVLRYPFDETLVMSEDQQWAKTVLEGGHTIAYEPGAEVYHSHHYTCRQVFQRYFDSGASLGHVVKGGLGTPLSQQLGYIARECRRALHQESVAHVPFVLTYEACRIAGYLAGKAEPLLPVRVKTALSANRQHWLRNRKRTAM